MLLMLILYLNQCLVFLIFTIFVSESQVLIQKSSPSYITLQHCHGTNPVVYSTENWLRDCRENPFIRFASTLLHESSK